MTQLYRHPLTAAASSSSSSGQPYAVGYIIRKRPSSSSGSSIVSTGGPYDYDYDGFAGKEIPASRSVNDGKDEVCC